MKPNQLKNYLKATFTANLELGERQNRGEKIHIDDYFRTGIIGGVGIAKTSIVQQAAVEIDFGLWGYEAASSDPSDLGGIPFDSGDFVKYRRVEKLPKRGERTIIFCDEMGQADKPQRYPVTKILNDREINGHEISELSSVVCAWNPANVRADSTRPGNNFLTRLAQITLAPDITDWINYARSRRLDERVLGFIASAGLPALVDFDANRESGINANPRTWFMAARQLTLNLPKTEEMEAVAGCVGLKLMAQFYEFCSMRHKLPLPATIFAAPDTAPLPNTAVEAWSVATSLIAASQYATFAAGLKYLERTNSAEFVMFYLNGLAAREKEEKLLQPFTTHPDYNRVMLAINSKAEE